MRQCSVEISFVREKNVTVAVVTVAIGDSADTQNGQKDDYDSDEDACSDNVSEVAVRWACVTRSRKIV